MENIKNSESNELPVDGKKKISRRGFLKTCAIAAGGMTVLCSGLGIAGASKPKVDYYAALDSENSNSDHRILLAYGSVCGSTGEIAKSIADELKAANLVVDVLPVQDVKSLDGYDTLILGSANRMGRLCQHTRQFIGKFKREIAEKKTAYFDVGMVMKEDTPENRAEAQTYLQPLIDIKEPFSTEVFGGKVDLSKVEYAFQLTMKNDTSGALEEGDFRDWTKIKAWGQALSSQLQSA